MFEESQSKYQSVTPSDPSPYNTLITTATMKITTITALLSLGLSVSAAPSLKKRLNHPSIPKSEAAVVQSIDASTTSTDPIVAVWIEANETVSNTVEIFVTGPLVDPQNVTSANMRDWAVAVLDLSSNDAVDEAGPSSDAEPQVAVWAEGPVNGTSTETSTAVDVFISRPSADGDEVTTGDLREIAVAILELAKKAEEGLAKRPGPYVPGWNSVGLE